MKARRGLTLAMLSLAVLAGCSDQIVSVQDGAAQDAAGAVAAGTRMPDGDVCPNLAVPDGSRLHLRVYANGTQIYRWTGSQWSFVAPSAVLTAERNGAGVIGTHYAGPTWESFGGGKVVGTVRARCTPDPSAIPWLLLDATPMEQRGIFRGVTLIQRVRTAGGLAPVQPGSVAGEEAHVPYTTEYMFYRSE